MQTWRQRVWITAGAAAMAGVVTTWFIASARFKLVVIDEAEMAEAALGRYAALTFAEAPANLMGWTTVRFETNGTTAVWGGYASVDVTIPPAAASGWGDEYDGPYTFAGRVDLFSGYAAEYVAHRGFIDTYTNALGRNLLDLGPSGGSIRGTYGAIRVGGWALTGDYGYDLVLPPGKDFASAWFMRVNFGSASYSTHLYARDYDPADCTATPGPIVTNRIAWWEPVTARLATNEILSLPIRHEQWSDNYTLTLADRIAGVAAPRLILVPIVPWIDFPAPLASMISEVLNTSSNVSVPRSFVDFAQATESETDFHEWPGIDGAFALPGILRNVGYATSRLAWLNWVSAGETAIHSRPAFAGLGNAFKASRTLMVEGVWTNGILTTYESDWFLAADYGGSLESAYAAMIASPNFTAREDTVTNAAPTYELWVDSTIAGSVIGYKANLFVCQAQPLGLLGLGHATNEANEATAHIWCEDAFEVPEGETIVRGSNILVRVRRDSPAPGARWLFDADVPATAPVPPPSSFWPTWTDYTSGVTTVGFQLDDPVVVSWPGWRAAP